MGGVGGVGKTEVAYEYAYSRLNHFYAVIWLNAENQHSLDESFGEVAV
jgi:anion-transporting  ArsA/GET3 family ATPase